MHGANPTYGLKTTLSLHMLEKAGKAEQIIAFDPAGQQEKEEHKTKPQDHR